MSATSLAELRTHLTRRPGTTEETPFGPQVLVYKVMGTMYALLAWEETPLRISIKCKPERALEMRKVFESVRGAYHMNKTHWNMVDIDGSVPDEELLAWIDESYDLIADKLPKAKKAELAAMK